MENLQGKSSCSYFTLQTRIKNLYPQNFILSSLKDSLHFRDDRSVKTLLMQDIYNVEEALFVRASPQKFTNLTIGISKKPIRSKICTLI